jgi:SNARE domain
LLIVFACLLSLTCRNANIAHGHSLSKSIESALNTKMPSLLAGDKAGSAAKKTAHKTLLANFGTLVKEFRDVAAAAKRNTAARPLASSASVVPSYGSSASSGAGATANPFASGSSSAPSSSSGVGGGRNNRNEAQIMAQLQQVDLTEALMAEREQGIDEVAQEVVAVNEVMRDLAGLVNEQGKQLEDLETNVTSAQKSTETGVGHLQQAAKYAGRYRKCLLGLVLLLILIAAGLTAYFLITNNKKSS